MLSLKGSLKKQKTFLGEKGSLFLRRNLLYDQFSWHVVLSLCDQLNMIDTAW
jgi:hypothetical protein